MLKNEGLDIVVANAALAQPLVISGPKDAEL